MTTSLGWLTIVACTTLAVLAFLRGLHYRHLAWHKDEHGRDRVIDPWAFEKSIHWLVGSFLVFIAGLAVAGVLAGIQSPP